MRSGASPRWPSNSRRRRSPGSLTLATAALVAVASFAPGCATDTRNLEPGPSQAGSGGGQAVSTGGQGGEGGLQTGGSGGGAGGEGGTGGGGTSDSRPPDLQAVDSRPEAPRSDGGCNVGRMDARKVAPQVLVVFDRSSAMRRTVPGSTATRWKEVSDGLDVGLQASHERVQWGLKLFPTLNAGACDVTEGLEVGIAPTNHAAVLSRVRGTEPMTGTGMEGAPIHRAVRSATNALTADLANVPRFLVVATDGTLGCPAGDPGINDLRNSVLDAANRGVHTFVLGTAVAGSAQDQLLGQVATAGREALPTARKYHPVQTKADVAQALDDLTRRVTSCVWIADGIVNPAAVAVEIAGERVPRDDQRQNGWSLERAGSLQNAVHLYGPACDRLRADPALKVTMVYGCAGVPPA